MDLGNYFNDSVVYEKQPGKLIQVPAGNGFNFGYVLFIPNNISDNTTMIVEGANAPSSTDNFKEAKDVALNGALHPSLPIYNIAIELGLPVLYPLFPRVYNGNETIYNHMLATNCLKSDTPMLKEYDLERVDLQLINMFNDVKKRLEGIDITLDDKFIIDGFSATSKFANRFTILHPEMVKMCIAGGVSGVLTLPLDKIGNEFLLWPVGIGNIKELISDNIDEEKIEKFKSIRQFYFMGNQDRNNNPFVFNENGEVKYAGIINKDELEQMNRIFGKDAIDDRWEKTQELYNELGVNVTFKTYEGIGHDPQCAYNDIKEEIINILSVRDKVK